MTTFLDARVSRPSLDYYLIYPESPDGADRTRPEGILVEEFVLAEDYSAVRLDSTGWAPGDHHWWSSPAVSRAVRVDANLRGRVVAASRHEVELAYRRLGGGELPDEETLRGYFHDGQPLSTAPLLRLGGPGQVGTGFHDTATHSRANTPLRSVMPRETRVYRILFANELGEDGLAALRAAWRMTVAVDAADPRARVMGTAHRRVGDDAFTWDLRRIGIGAAWCVDLTANLASSRDNAIGPLLRELTTQMRAQGLIPVTIERFS